MCLDRPEWHPWTEGLPHCLCIFWSLETSGQSPGQSRVGAGNEVVMKILHTLRDKTGPIDLGIKNAFFLIFFTYYLLFGTEKNVNCSKFPMVFFGHHVLGLATDVAVPGCSQRAALSAFSSLIATCPVSGSIWEGSDLYKEPKTWRASQLTSLLFLREPQIIRGSKVTESYCGGLFLFWFFSFLLHNTLKIFADLIPDSSCSGRTLTGRMRASACSASKVLYGQSHRHAEG